MGLMGAFTSYGAILAIGQNERVIGKVAARLRGTIHHAVEGNVMKIKVRY
jgi:hypothetical protein